MALSQRFFKDACTINLSAAALGVYICRRSFLWGGMFSTNLIVLLCYTALTKVWTCTFCLNMESDKSGVWIKNGSGSGFAYQDRSTHFVCFLGKEEEEEEYRGFIA